MKDCNHVARMDSIVLTGNQFYSQLFFSTKFFKFFTFHLFRRVKCLFRYRKRFRHKCFPVKFGKYLRTPILKKICERLLLALPDI